MNYFDGSVYFLTVFSELLQLSANEKKSSLDLTSDAILLF